MTTIKNLLIVSVYFFSFKLNLSQERLCVKYLSSLDRYIDLHRFEFLFLDMLRFPINFIDGTTKNTTGTLFIRWCSLLPKNKLCLFNSHLQFVDDNQNFCQIFSVDTGDELSTEWVTDYDPLLNSTSFFADNKKSGLRFNVKIELACASTHGERHIIRDFAADEPLIKLQLKSSELCMQRVSALRTIVWSYTAFFIPLCLIQAFLGGFFNNDLPQYVLAVTAYIFSSLIILIITHRLLPCKSCSTMHLIISSSSSTLFAFPVYFFGGLAPAFRFICGLYLTVALQQCLGNTSRWTVIFILFKIFFSLVIKYKIPKEVQAAENAWTCAACLGIALFLMFTKPHEAHYVTRGNWDINVKFIFLIGLSSMGGLWIATYQFRQLRLRYPLGRPHELLRSLTNF